MTQPLLAVSLADPHRLITTHRLLSSGLGANEVGRMVRAGELIRVRRGQFVRREDWPTSLENQHVVHLAAAMANHRDQLIAASHSAALVHRLATFGCDLTMLHTIRRTPGFGQTVRSSGSRLGLTIGHPVPGAAIQRIGGLAVGGAALAGLQVAVDAGVVAGVVTLDSAIHQGKCTPPEIWAALDLLSPRPGLRHARRAAALADGRAESPGESRLRLTLLDLGYRIESQVRILNRSGVIARADFYLRECRIIIEFDGAVKYEGHDGRAALMAEKIREDRLRAAGFEIVRFIWGDLNHPALIREKMEAAVGRARQRGHRPVPSNVADAV